MISYFEFIDKKPDGTKERVLGTTIYLYNKLSADETNAIRAKLNELVDAANFSVVPLYEVFALKFKGAGNLDMLNIEVGDIATRYSTTDGIWENAEFNGGDPQDPANYTLLPSKPEPVLFVTTGASNSFTLPTGMLAGSLFIDRGLKYKITADNPTGEWEQVGADVVVTGATLAAGRKVYITP